MTPPELPDERGSAKYFHGRDHILDSFGYRIKKAVGKKEGGGTTFLIQGPPGAGKTALLHHCRNLAALHGWQTAKIDPVSLWNTDDTCARLGRKWYDAVKGVRIAGEIMSIPATVLSVDFDKRATSPLLMIQGGKGPLLLFMDEAQLLRGLDRLAEVQRGQATTLLEHIHNGAVGRPVILLVAGLGTTRQSLKALGVSRYEDACSFEMGALDKGAERDLIMDWLVNEGGISLGAVASWVDAIVPETYRWPQHIIAYVKSALVQIHKDEGALTEAGLDATLIAGRKRKESYYRERAERLGREERITFARLIAEGTPDNNLFTKQQILDKLSVEHGDAKASELFQIAREDGVLYYDDGDYAVPIPSMSDWFLDNYLPERGHNPGLER